MNRFVIFFVALAAFSAADINKSSSALSSTSSESTELSKDEIVQLYYKKRDANNIDPVWLSWKPQNLNLPPNAVFAGFDDKFGASYVIRADHMTPQGVYIGKILGKYFPYSRVAMIGFNGVEYNKTRFDVMTHNRPLWTEMHDSRPMIAGSYGNNVCRVQHALKFWTPGKLHSGNRLCIYPWQGGEIISPSFQVLRRVC